MTTSLSPAARLRKDYQSSDKSLAKCIVCSGNDFKAYRFTDRHDLGMTFSLCKSCGMLSINPRPDQSFFDAFYADHFWDTYIAPEIESTAQLYEIDRPDIKATHILQRLDTYLNRNKARVLDVGSGLGGMLSALKSIYPDYEAIGIDPSREGVQFSKSNCNNALNIGFDQIRKQFDFQFDYVFSIHVIEHLNDPVKMLKEVALVMKEGGIAYFEVPDILSFKWRHLGLDYFHIAHIHYFSRHTIESIVNQAGFEVIEVIKGAAEAWPWAIGVVCRKADSSDLKARPQNYQSRSNYEFVRTRMFLAQHLGV